MPTTTTGTFFLARQRPQTSVEDGEFRLVLRVVDRQGANKTEPYVVTWAGPAAAMWFNEHGHQLQPGCPLELELHNPRSFAPRLAAPETHATVARLALGKPAPSHIVHQARQAQHTNNHASA